MSCLGTGKITEQLGLREALKLVRAKPADEGVLRILSKEASGRIGVRGGRFIIGAHITASGLSGYPALKVFLSLRRGMFYYLEGEQAGGLTDLEQALGVDIEGLLFHGNTADDLLRRFAEMSGEYSWDCLSEVFVNPHPVQAGNHQFGDGLLDRLAWTATNTIQRLQSLTARQQATLQATGTATPTHTAVARPPVSAEQAPSHSLPAPAALHSPTASPFVFQTPGAGIESAPSAGQLDQQAAAVQPQTSIAQPSSVLAQPAATFAQPLAAAPPSAPPSAPATFVETPAQPAQTPASAFQPPPAGIHSQAGAPQQAQAQSPIVQALGAAVQQIRSTYTRLARVGVQQPSTPSLAQPWDNLSPPLPQPVQPVQAVQPVADAVPPNMVARQSAQTTRPAVDIQTQTNDDGTPSWLPPPPKRSSGTLPALPVNDGDDSSAWYRPSRDNLPPMVFSGQPNAQQEPAHNIFGRIARTTMQGLKALRLAPQPDSENSAGEESFFGKLTDTARSTMQGLQALGRAPTPEEIVTIANQQRKRVFAKPARATHERMRAFAERTAESQKLRVMDIEDALAAHEQAQPTVKKLAKSFDLASAAGLFVIGGAIILFTVGFLTMRAVTSGDESINLAKQYAKEGKNKLAIEQITLALQKKEGDIDLLMWRAQLYDQLSDFEHEAQDYDAIVNAHPDCKMAAIKGAMLSNRLAQYNRTMDITKPLLERFPHDVDVMAVRAMALSFSGDYQNALDQADKIKDDNSVSKELRGALARARGYAYLNLNHAQKAMPYYRQALLLDPKNAVLYHEVAQVFERLGENDSAIEHLKKAIEMEPSNGWNYEELGKAYDLKRDYASAIKAYNDAVKMIPRPADDYARMAHDELQLQHYAQALTDCDMAERLVPRHPEAEKVKDIALAKQKSEKPIQTAQVDTEPKEPLSDPNSSISKGFRALKQGEYKQAVQYLTAAIKHDGEDPEARLLLALAYSRLGRNADAYNQFAWLDAARHLPVNYKMIFAECAMNSGHPERALTLYGDCLEDKPDWVEARCKMIRACLATGLTERANAVAQEGIIRAKDESEKQMYQAALNNSGRK